MQNKNSKHVKYMYAQDVLNLNVKTSEGSISLEKNSLKIYWFLFHFGENRIKIDKKVLKNVKH